MKIETSYRVVLSWEARDIDIQRKIEDKVDYYSYQAQKAGDGTKIREFTGNAACSPYYEIFGDNRKTVQDIYKKISMIIMSYKGSKIID